MCLDILERIENDKIFFKHIIKADETWIFEYDPDTKRQSWEWHKSKSPRPKKVRMSKSKIKTMLICFLDSQGVVHKEFMPPGQTVNKQYYREFLERLRKRLIVSGQRLRKLGCCITTMLPVTLPTPWTNVWPKFNSVVPQPP